MEKLVLILRLCSLFLILHCIPISASPLGIKRALKYIQQATNFPKTTEIGNTLIPESNCHESAKKPFWKDAKVIVKSLFTFSGGKTEDIAFHALIYDKSATKPSEIEYRGARADALRNRIAFRSDGSLVDEQTMGAILRNIEREDKIYILVHGYIEEILSLHLINGIGKIFQKSFGIKFWIAIFHRIDCRELGKTVFQCFQANKATNRQIKFIPKLAT